jgi:hypothetical protein
MAKRLLLLSYAFPPGNIVGAVRPFQMATYFARLGWEICVVCCRDASIPDDYLVDLSTFKVSRIEAPPLLAWMNSAPRAVNDRFGIWRNRAIRVLRFVMRSLFFPEPFVLIRQQMREAAENMMKELRFDLIISSALPFTVHLVARDLACRYKVPWVADNRDLWASSPYRQLMLPRRTLDCRFERQILSNADLVLGVSDAMADYYRRQYRLNSVLKVMNGYSSSQLRETLTGDVSIKVPRQLEVMYGGGLYAGRRDPSPLLIAIAGDENLACRVKVSFYGAEPECVAALSEAYPSCRIECHGRTSKDQIVVHCREASILLVVLGESEFENGVMTGKFFEYLAFAKPVLAIANDDSELAMVVNRSGIGLGSRNPDRISLFLRQLLDGSRSLKVSPPEHLSIEHQLSCLFEAVERIQTG